MLSVPGHWWACCKKCGVSLRHRPRWKKYRGKSLWVRECAACGYRTVYRLYRPPRKPRKPMPLKSEWHYKYARALLVNLQQPRGSMPTVWGYGRVSTQDQANGQEVQSLAIRQRYEGDFKAQGYAWGGMFFDRGESGGKPIMSRPFGAHVISKAQRGDVIIITKLDRGFRRLHDMLNTLELWNATGVHLCVLNIGVDGSKPIGRLMLALLGAIAEFERELARERAQDLRLMRRAQGKPSAPHPPYGYKIVGGEFQPDPEWRALGALAVALHDEDGLSFTHIYKRWLFEGVRFAANQRGKDTPICRKSIHNWYHAELQLRAAEQQKAMAQ